MKKLFMMLFVFCLLVTSVFAQNTNTQQTQTGNNNNKGNGNGSGFSDVLVNSQNKNTYQNRNQLRMCENEEFCSYNETKIGNMTMVRERITARFLFWNVDAETVYDIDDSNVIVGHKNNFWKYMYNNKLIKQRSEQ